MFSKNKYFFKKNGDFVENILEKKIIFFLAILTFFMAALDAQRNFMPTRYFFSFYLFWIKSYSIFCQKVAKVEHTIDNDNE